MKERAYLVLEDGECFEGFCVNMELTSPVSGEVVFNTVHQGYQEVLTDPSYCGQMVAFTYPHFGNYGIRKGHDESARIWARAVIVRQTTPSPPAQACSSVESWLAKQSVPLIEGIDTRRLTRHLREAGSLRAGIAKTYDQALKAAREDPGTVGQNLVREVSTRSPYLIEGPQARRVVVWDFGVKTSTLDALSAFSEVEVVPWNFKADEVLACLEGKKGGVLLSNGPGDPAALSAVAGEIKKLIGKVPIMGICMGHQLLSLALGARTYKLRFGHHGGNHPVKELATGKVEITSQNHNYAVDPASLPSEVEVSHINLNDEVVEGIASEELRLFSVQYHPEAGPGPHESRYLFERFRSEIERG